MRLHFPWWLEPCAFVLCAVPLVWFLYDAWETWRRRRAEESELSGVRLRDELEVRGPPSGRRSLGGRTEEEG